MRNNQYSAAFLAAMDALRITYRGFNIQLEGTKPLVLALIIPTDSEDLYIASAGSVFAAAERAFDLIDELMLVPSSSSAQTLTLSASASYTQAASDCRDHRLARRPT
jgi:hypothetical protein